MATYATWFAQQLLIIMFIVFVFAFTITKVTAFRVKLYQRDSYGSPFYNSSQTKSEIIRKAIARSVNISNIITPNSVKAKLILHRSDYLVHIRLGTPAIDVFALLDTGSDFTWIQCQPCIHCVPQLTPLYDPKASSSYDRISCGPTNPCPSKYSGCKADGFCHYDTQYNDGSYSKGLLSKETMRMESTLAGEIIEIPNYIFGCGTDNDAKSGAQISAVIGLGVGPQSLVKQLGSHSMHTFSYCLIPLGSRKRVNHIRFGPSAKVHGSGLTVTMPLVSKHSSNLYFVTLEAFTIGSNRIEFVGSSGLLEEGNIAIDSGTALTMVPNQIYIQIKHAVTMQASAPPVPDPDGLFGLCFKKDKSLQLPTIVANFRGGDVSLKQHNTFVSLDQIECLAFRVFEGVPLYGSVAQQDFIVGYDRLRGTISFKPFKCSDF